MRAAWGPLLVGGLLLLAGCKQEDMYSQRKADNWDRSTFFDNHSSMRHPVEGTEPRDAANPEVAEPTVITAALLNRGEERFGIFCTPCHGRSGHGEGMIVQRGFPHPPSLVEGKLREAKAQVFYDAMTHGYGAMYSFADRVSPADRWAVIAYIRALQLSQDADPATLPAADRTRLEAAR